MHFFKDLILRRSGSTRRQALQTFQITLNCSIFIRGIEINQRLAEVLDSSVSSSPWRIATPFPLKIYGRWNLIFIGSIPILFYYSSWFISCFWVGWRRKCPNKHKDFPMKRDRFVHSNRIRFNNYRRKANLPDQCIAFVPPGFNTIIPDVGWRACVIQV